MKISIVIVLAFLVNLLDVCLSDKHTYGTFRESREFAFSIFNASSSVLIFIAYSPQNSRYHFDW